MAFGSTASDLVAGDTNGKSDVFVHDRLTGATSRVSLGLAGAQENGDSDIASISGDGRFVAFVSVASNLVAGDNNNVQDVFVRDRLLGTTLRVSVDPQGGNANGESYLGGWGCVLSTDGRYIVFESHANNLVAGDTNTIRDAFVRDLQAGVTERISLDSSGAQANGTSGSARISGDGRFVAFMSYATNLVPLDFNWSTDIFVRDRLAGTTEIASVGNSGNPSDGDSIECALSADGRYIAFTSESGVLVAGENNSTWDVFLRDRLLATTERISVSSSGAGSNAYCWGTAISGDGRFVAFMGTGTNLVAGDTNGLQDIFVRDRLLATTERVSVGTTGGQGDGNSDRPSLSLDGRYVAFSSGAANLVSGDTNGTIDIFGRDWRGSSGIDTCQPGAGVVIACPCSNPPANSPRGCDNSAASGGARLHSTGAPSLGLDTLVFTTDGEPATALSIVLQGTSELTGGVVFGQGVRCVVGVLRRLYVQNAVGGSIAAPAAGEPSVSSRSAALGAPIPAGARRWYAVYYRDPIVTGGCPATSTFNTTQTQLVSWDA